tara:strand:- start:1189 stop:1599 length:411 start_codon:yes stop_codon:yes gene_type:complete
MKQMLLEMIEASRNASNCFDMEYFYDYDDQCGAICCLMGDLALHREPNAEYIDGVAEELAFGLDKECKEFFGDSYLSSSIWAGYVNARMSYAIKSGLFTEKELKHKHLTTEHQDREIAIDYIYLVIKKIEERENGA